MRLIPALTSAVAAACLGVVCSTAISQSTAPATKPATAPAATATAPATTAPVATATATKPVDPTKLDEKGYIRQWLILAPIGYGEKYLADDIEKESIAGEANFAPKAGDKVNVTSEDGEPGAYKTVKKDLTWKQLVTSDYYFDVNEMLKLDASDGMGSYAAAYLDVPQEMTGIKFGWCSNDNGLIYLNGKKIAQYVGGRGLSEDADVTDNLTLKKGINVVIFKVWNDSNNWQGCIRLLTKDDKPVTGVKVQLTK